MTPEQAIEIADREGFCHIGQHTYLWKTCEAVTHVKLDNINVPFVLVIEGSWANTYPVKNAKNERLIKAVGERK